MYKRQHATALRRLGEDYPVWLAGRGATPRVLEEVGVRYLGADLVGAVAELTATARDRRNQREAAARPDGDGIPVDDSRANGIQGDGIRTDGIQGDGIRTDGIQGDGIRTDATTPTSATA